MIWPIEEELPPNVREAYTFDEIVVRDWLMEKADRENPGRKCRGIVSKTLITKHDDGSEEWTLRNEWLKVYSTTLTQEEISEIVAAYGTKRKKVKYRLKQIAHEVGVCLILLPLAIVMGVIGLVDKIRSMRD